ncbi:hypothetical protein ACFSYD_26230 [Paracoccus aerius]
MATVSAPGACRAQHLDDVGTAARLRDADAGPLRQMQRPPIDRGDGRPQRGHGQALFQLDRVFQIGRRMVRRPARDGGDHHGRAVAQRRRRRQHGVAAAVQETTRGFGDFGDLARHVALVHPGLLSVSGADFSSTAKS